MLFQECGFEIDEDQKQQFVAIGRILTELNNNLDCSLALEWAQAHSSSISPKLAFKLHRLHYIKLLHAGNAEEALQYARQNFMPGFLVTEAQEVHRLMGALLFIGKMDQSPYEDFQNLDTLKNDAISFFSAEYCRVLDLATFPPLQTWYSIFYNKFSNILITLH